ncbi:MAG: hypothetical protein ABI317_07310 [Gaiellales bacterium]
MASEITRRLRGHAPALLGVFAAAALVAAAPAAAATAQHRPGHHHPRQPGHVFAVKGTLAAAPGASPTTLSVTVSGGNRPALRALLGNTTQPLTFTVDANTSYIDRSASERGNAPTATIASTLAVGDPVVLRLRASYGTPLATLLTTPTRIVTDLAAAQKVSGRLFLFAGRAVSVDTTAQTVTIDIHGGNRPALRALLGQPATETFHYDASTLFLSWSHRTPHTFLPAQIQVGDPITLRSRVDFDTPLATLLTTPLWKINDHEPARSFDSAGGSMTSAG